MPLAALVMFGLVVFFVRRWKKVSKVGSSSALEGAGATTDSAANSALHPSYTKVIIVSKEGKAHELPDFHLPLTARLSDARQAFKSSLPAGMLVCFLSSTKEDVPLLLERSTTVGEIMKGGAMTIRDVTGKCFHWRSDIHE